MQIKYSQEFYLWEKCVESLQLFSCFGSPKSSKTNSLGILVYIGKIFCVRLYFKEWILKFIKSVKQTDFWYRAAHRVGPSIVWTASRAGHFRCQNRLEFFLLASLVQNRRPILRRASFLCRNCTSWGIVEIGIWRYIRSYHDIHQAFGRQMARHL